MVSNDINVDITMSWLSMAIRGKYDVDVSVAWYNMLHLTHLNKDFKLLQEQSTLEFCSLLLTLT